MLLTVLTPTYNRAALLPRLFESLCRQTCKDFEWIVVDDGSTDETEAVVRSVVREAAFAVRYLRKENGGKHTAVNLGVRQAEGELTLILDSDDELPFDSVADIRIEWDSIKNKTLGEKAKDIGGICGYMSHGDGTLIGTPKLRIDCDSLELRYRYHVVGDMCEVFRTEVLRRFPFPQIEGEYFCPEALVWNRIAQCYILHVFPKVIYLRDYLDGGLTDNIVRIRMRSPMASMMTYGEMLAYDIPVREKAKAAINYWRFRCCAAGEAVAKVSWRWAWAWPLGWLMHQRDKRIVREKTGK